MRDCCLVNHCPICYGERDKDNFVCPCHNPEIQAIQRERLMLSPPARDCPGDTWAMKGTEMKKLQVWWIPQVPMKAFNVPVKSIAEGIKILDTLAFYDIFQFENNIKPDYCNAGGLQEWVEDAGEGEPGWVDWYDEETGCDDPTEYLALNPPGVSLSTRGNLPAFVLKGHPQ